MSTPLQRSVNQAQAGGWVGANNITRSAWFDGSADYLERSAPGASATNLKECIVGGWFRPVGEAVSDVVLVGADTSSSAFLHFRWNVDTSDGAFEVVSNNPTTILEHYFDQNRELRDTEWYHVLFSVDTSQAASADRIRAWLNGIEMTANVVTAITQNANLVFGGNHPYQVNHFGYANTQALKGSLAQVFCVQGLSIQQGDYAPTDFGESVTAGTNGSIWAPVLDSTVKTAVDAGDSNNSFLLSSDIGDGTDDSVHANNFTPTSMSDATNGSNDTPSDPYPVFNELHKSGVTKTISEGGNTCSLNAGVGWVSLNVLVPPTGKYYCEFDCTTVNNGNTAIGVCNPHSEQDATPRASGFLHWEADGDRYLDGVQTATEVTSWTSADVVGLGINMDDKELLFYDNAGNLDATVSFGSNVDGSSGVLVYLGQLSGSGSQQASLIIESADMTHGLPTDYSELKVANFPAPAAQGADLFNPVLYTGDGVAIGSGGNAITGAGFQPDLVWIKHRSAGGNHRVTDSSRGATIKLSTDSTAVESTEAEGLTSFDSDGFTVGSNTGYNQSTVTYAGWCWKLAGGTETTNNNGSVTTTVQANDFMSLILWQSPNASGSAYTVGHGLTSPDLLIVRPRDAVSSWYTTGRIGALPTFAGESGFYVILDGSNARFTDGLTSGLWTTSTFSGATDTFEFGTNTSIIQGDDQMLALAFKNVPGVCHIGEYTGNASTDGPFVHTGFRPRWIMIKGNVSPQEWLIYDTARDPFNDAASLYLEPDTTNTEGTNFKDVDILANGFKLRDVTATHNQSGTKYMYLALADVATGSGLPPIPGR
jgi:hypothetical protein